MTLECEHPKQVVCGVIQCGRCYETWLLTAPDRNRGQKPLPPLRDAPFAAKFEGYGPKAAA